MPRHQRDVNEFLLMFSSGWFNFHAFLSQERKSASQTREGVNRNSSQATCLCVYTITFWSHYKQYVVFVCVNSITLPNAVSMLCWFKNIYLRFCQIFFELTKLHNLCQRHVRGQHNLMWFISELILSYPIKVSFHVVYDNGKRYMFKTMA